MPWPSVETSEGKTVEQLKQLIRPLVESGARLYEETSAPAAASGWNNSLHDEGRQEVACNSHLYSSKRPRDHGV